MLFWCKSKFKENGKSSSMEALMEGICYADAEQRFVKYMEDYKKEGEYEAEIVKKNITEIFEAEDRENYYMMKIQIIVYDDKSGTEKRANKIYLAHADSIEDAIRVTEAAMKGSMSDYEIISVSRTELLDVVMLGNKPNEA